MIITHKLTDLVEYKILTGQHDKLKQEVTKLEKQLTETDEAIDCIQTASDLLGMNFSPSIDILVERRSRIDQQRIRQALALNTIEKRLLEFEAQIYK